MRFPIMCAALVASLFASTGAHANSFSGFRLEVRTGYDNNSADGVSAGGILGGVGGGYDAEVSTNVVIGMEANVDFASTKYTIDYGSYTGNIHTQRDIEVSARIGYKASPKAMFYAKGGYSNGGFAAESHGPGLDYSASDTTDGYRLGIGFERLVGKHGYAKTEYRYTRYGSAKIDRNQLILAAGWRF